MIELTTRERMLRTYRRQDVDRILMVDYPWAGTIKRWHAEGLPKNVEWDDYFGYDKIVQVWPDNSPRFEEKIIDALIEKLEADIPEAMFVAEAENFVRDYDNRLRAQGLDLNTYFKYTGLTLDALREALKGQDINLIKQRQEELQKDFYALSEKMYKAAQEAAQAQGGAPGADAGYTEANYTDYTDDNQ